MEKILIFDSIYLITENTKNFVKDAKNEVNLKVMKFSMLMEWMDERLSICIQMGARASESLIYK
ncbi:MAG: hypothetical protein D6799_01170 [Bacteroidetes bacterium]|nr:MAG: hypothetical protein D6799_01170 [Bacteroidota bacterium]